MSHKMTTEVRHIASLGQYECLKCGSKNTGIAGEAIGRIMTNYSDPIYQNVYRGYCINECNLKDWVEVV
jgi:hypothetical protein